MWHHGDVLRGLSLCGCTSVQETHPLHARTRHHWRTYHRRVESAVINVGDLVQAGFEKFSGKGLVERAVLMAVDDGLEKAVEVQPSIPNGFSPTTLVFDLHF